MRGVLEDYYTTRRRPAVDGNAGICKDSAACGSVWILGAGADGAGSEVGCKEERIEVPGYPGGIEVVGYVGGEGAIGQVM